MYFQSLLEDKRVYVGRKMVHKSFHKHTVGLHVDEGRILLSIGSKKPYELITQSSIAKELNKHVASVNYHFKRLKEDKFLDEDYRLTKRGMKAIRYFIHYSKTNRFLLRGHKIQVVGGS